ncbi:MAG: phosphatase PAP2 family protein [Methylophaga sp.]|nr:phosphatase PAP2 family protein [Methylophaga sp.]
MIKSIVLTGILLVYVILLFDISNLDLLVQNYFYNSDLHQWILNDNDVVLDFIFYSGFKKALILFALSLLTALILFRKTTVIQHYKQGILIVLLSLILVPTTVGLLKSITNVPCPKHLVRYGGAYPYVKALKPMPSDFKREKQFKCFPAGHASGGFALMSLFFLFKTKRNQRLALASAISIGWITGGYKMLIGDHFLSHTIVTMLLAWIIILLITTTIQWYQIQFHSTQ